MADDKQKVKVTIAQDQWSPPPGNSRNFSMWQRAGFPAGLTIGILLGLFLGFFSVWFIVFLFRAIP